MNIHLFLGIIISLTGGINLYRNGLKNGWPALWVIKTSLCVFTAGIFEIFQFSRLQSTLPFCLQLPIFPLFNELSKSNGNVSLILKHAPSVIVMYVFIYSFHFSIYLFNIIYLLFLY